MNEDLLYFVWKFKLFHKFKIFDFDDGEIRILNPGIQNINSGPDFFNAQLQTDDAKWNGNIEVDVKSSDWYKHGHNKNKEFNNVVLQVVNVYDKKVFCESGRNVPVMEIEVQPEIMDQYQKFLLENKFIPCASEIYLADSIKINLWLANVLVERLAEKAEYIRGILTSHKNSWEETFYQLLARNFGFNVNSEPFEWLAKSLPLKYLAKHQNNLTQIEALLFGQAGFLEESIPQIDYCNNLKREFLFLQSKYQLKPLQKHIWKFLRIRPSNFPTIRISQFANLIYVSKSLFSKIYNAKSLSEIRNLFDIETSEFWKSHFVFEKQAMNKIKKLGHQSVDEILINTIVPILFVYGEMIGDEAIKERAIGYLEEINPERNHITRKWNDSGIKASSAFYSQALIHQKNHYCSHYRCLECGIGVEILKAQYLKSGIKPTVN
jgi:hypothetical protein